VNLYDKDPNIELSKINTTYTIPFIKAGESCTTNVAYIPRIGNQRIWIKIDSENLLEEKDESNIIISTTFRYNAPYLLIKKGGHHGKICSSKYSIY
jgi:hypothetical protein